MTGDRNGVSVGFGAASICACVLCWGSPDIVDGIVYKLTGVKTWEVQQTEKGGTE